MSDVEVKVSATLEAAAADAPNGVGLAAAARRRHRVRRQRRIAVGGALAALVVVVSAVAVGTRGGDGDVAQDPVDPPATRWQTIEHDGALASVPADWAPYFCSDDPTYAPPDVDPCVTGGGVWFTGEIELLTAQLGDVQAGAGPGEWAGTTSAGAHYLHVVTTDRDLTRQILATARLADQPVVDGSTWVSYSRGVIGYQLPAWWGMGEHGDRSDYATCVALDRSNGASSAEQRDAAHVVLTRAFDGFAVTVTAPTQAVAELVMATVEVFPEVSRMDDCTPEDFDLALLPPETDGGGVDPDGAVSRPGEMSVVLTLRGCRGSRDGC